MNLDFLWLTKRDLEINVLIPCAETVQARHTWLKHATLGYGTAEVSDLN